MLLIKSIKRAELQTTVKLEVELEKNLKFAIELPQILLSL